MRQGDPRCGSSRAGAAPGRAASQCPHDHCPCEAVRAELSSVTLHYTERTSITSSVGWYAGPIAFRSDRVLVNAYPVRRLAVRELRAALSRGADVREDGAATARRLSIGLEHLRRVLSGDVVVRLHLRPQPHGVARLQVADGCACVWCARRRDAAANRDPRGWTPPTGHNPTFWLLGLLLVSVGLPFFVVSSTAPLLQRWFAGTDHDAAADPYFLFAASNAGSLLALLSYPALFEPLLRLRAQSVVWTGGYVLLAGLILACTLITLRRSAGRHARPEARPLADIPFSTATPVAGEGRHCRRTRLVVRAKRQRGVTG